MANTVIQEWTDEKGWIHRIEIPLLTFLIEHNLEPVVRCKDCRHAGECHKSVQYTCNEPNTVTIGYSPIEWCSRGERRENG